MLYAKSKDGESIREHTMKLIDNLHILKNEYGEDITEKKDFDIERFWMLLEMACLYHDVGKVYTPFQNEILKKLGLPTIVTEFDYKSVKHEQLSPLFIPVEKYKLSKKERVLLFQSIYYHHERDGIEIPRELVEKIIEKDIYPRIKLIEKEVGIEIEDLNTNYLSFVSKNKRIDDKQELYIEYCLLKGLLHRLDYSSSANLKVEEIDSSNIKEYVENFMSENDYEKNDIQNFASDNSNNNILVIGSTGIGKTEAALLWSNGAKTFFTLPIRISINAIFERIKKLGYTNVGLLHSTALDYLEGEKQYLDNEEFTNQFQIYEQSKNLCFKITTCTIDQIFPFVFKYKGYEKIYATLAYSKVIIDEIQAYTPDIVAIILKGLQMINNIGGKFMVMTATLPGIYKEELEKMGIDFKYNMFLKKVERHRIKMKNIDIVSDCEKMIEKSGDSKVLVIANTINKAIEVYRNLKDRGVDNVHLLHSRFILNDRNVKEDEIKKFSNEKDKKGIWITTQIVEASLDIDFDYLFTEMSTLDSLFQRLGRCYRNREYKKTEPNVYIYNKNASGVKYVYDREIHELSIKLLNKYDGEILTEENKIELVDKLYSKELIENTEFYKSFRKGMNVLNDIVDYDNNKSDAQKLLRNIENVTVIPKSIYDGNIDLFKTYDDEKNWINKSEIRRKINKLVTSISKSQFSRLRQYIVKNPYCDDIFIADLKYDREIGLLLEKDEEYELDERFC